MLLFAASLLLASTPDAGSAPVTVPATGGEVVALIWKGGKDAAAAQAALKDWEAERKLIAESLTLPEGFPKVVSSASVPGLNPGFEIVLLGFCRDDEGSSARRFLKALYPFSYEKPVKVDAPSCPTWVGKKPGERTIAPPDVLKARGATLTVAVADVQDKTPEYGQGDQPVRWIRIVARDATGKLLDAFSQDDTMDLIGGAEVGCDTQLSTTVSSVVMEEFCTSLAPAACNHNPSEKTQTTVRWDGTKLVSKRKTLEKRDVDFNKDCAE